MAKVKLGLHDLSPEEIVALTDLIVGKLTENAASFGTPKPTLAQMTTAKTDANTKINFYKALVQGAQAGLTARDGSTAHLCDLLTQLAGWAESDTQGDAAKLELGGFSVRSAGTPSTMTQVLELVLSQGDFEGDLDAMWHPIRGAKSFEIQISVDPVSANSWAYKMTAGMSSAKITGLTSGTKIWVRVRAIGPGNVLGPWSDPAVKMVP